MHFSNILRAFCAVTVGVAAARAGTTLYTSQSSWDSAVGATPLTTLDFNNTVPPNGVAGSDGLTYGAGPNGQWTSSLVNTGVTFNSTGSVFYASSAISFDAGFHTSDYLDWQGAANPDFGTLTVSLPTPTTAVGFLLGSFNASGGNATITINQVGYNAVMPFNSWGFFGFTTTAPVSSFTIHGTDNYTTMDNFQFASHPVSSVPDATSTAALLVLAAGLLWIAGCRRKEA